MDLGVTLANPFEILCGLCELCELCGLCGLCGINLLAISSVVILVIGDWQLCLNKDYRCFFYTSCHILIDFNTMASVVVKRADEVDAPRDAVLCMPRAPGPGARFPGNVRIPVRSSWMEGGYLQYEPGSRTVVAAAAADRLRRIVLSFPMLCFCHGIRSFGDDPGSSVLLSFALYEPRSADQVPPVVERALERMDALSAYLSASSLGCDTLRRVAGLLDGTPPEATMSVVRPGTGARYCSAKVATAAFGGRGPGGVPERPMTAFLAPNGTVVPLARVREWRNFGVAPYVAVEEIFVSGGRRSLQLWLRECVVHPPAASPGLPPPAVPRGDGEVGRPSAAFPGRTCGGSGGTESETKEDAAAVDYPPPSKRPRH